MRGSSCDARTRRVPERAGQPSPWRRFSDGGAEQPSQCSDHDGRLRFDRPLPDAGYSWFYLDALSDDGSSSLVLLFMLGNVFSPRRYAAMRQNLPLSPLAHPAVNVSLRQGRSSTWVMTEDVVSRVWRTSDSLTIGANSIAWEGSSLVATIDERSAPWRSRVRGRVRVEPLVASPAWQSLDGSGRHLWNPHTPVARVHVDFQEPRVAFSGTGYADANAGDEPLERAFRSWSWSHFSVQDRAHLSYDVVDRAGLSHARAPSPMDTTPGLLSRPDASDVATRLPYSLGTSTFGLARPIYLPVGSKPRLVRTLEDGPFYVRSVVRARLGERCEEVLGVHETVSLERFEKPWVRFLLPFRMRRAW